MVLQAMQGLVTLWNLFHFIFSYFSNYVQKTFAVNFYNSVNKSKTNIQLYDFKWLETLIWLKYRLSTLMPATWFGNTVAFSAFISRTKWPHCAVKQNNIISSLELWYGDLWFHFDCKQNVTINSQANSCGRKSKWFQTTHTFNASFFILIKLPLSTESSQVSCIRLDIEICDSF